MDTLDSPFSFMALPTQIGFFSQTLPCRTDGLKAFVYSTNYGQRTEMQLFRNMQDLQTVVVTGMPSLSSLVAEFVEGSIVLADQYNGMNVGEYLVGNGIPLETFKFGNEDTQAPAILRTNSGHLVIVGYRHDSSVTIDAVVRNPSVSSSPGVIVPSRWEKNTFFLVPGPVGIPSMQLALVEGTDGLIYCFMVRDSSHTVKLLRMRIVGGKLEMVDYDDSFLHETFINGILRDGEISPDGEFPFLSVAKDWVNGRVLVCYGQSRWIYSEDRSETVLTRPVVTGVYPNKSKVLVQTMKDCVNRSITRSPILVTPSGLICIYNFILDNNNTWQWRLNRGGETFVMATSNYAPSVAVSSDGWCAFKEADEKLTLGPLPLLSYKKEGDNLIISWFGDGILQETTDFKTWKSVAYNSPATVVIEPEVDKFFRVKY